MSPQGPGCDVHVIRLAKEAELANSNDQEVVRAELSEGLPSDLWPRVNPVFGGLGQMLGDSGDKVRRIIRSTAASIKDESGYLKGFAERCYNLPAYVPANRRSWQAREHAKLPPTLLAGS